MTYAEALSAQPELATERLLLRRPVDGDIPAIIRIAGDWVVASQLARMPYPYAPSDARFFIDSIVTTELTWMIVDRSTGERIGIVGLSAGDHDTVWLAYYVDPAAWGRGIATEAAAAAVHFAFATLDCTRLTSGYFADNPASGRILSKLGFVTTGTVEHACLATRSERMLVEMIRDRGAASGDTAA